MTQVTQQSSAIDISARADALEATMKAFSWASTSALPRFGDCLFPVYKKLSDRDKRLATDEGYHVPPREDLMPRRLSA